MIYNLNERLASAWRAFKAEPATIRQERWEEEKQCKLDAVTHNAHQLPTSAQDRIDRFIMSAQSFNNKEVVAFIEDISGLPLPVQYDIIKMAVTSNPALVGFSGMQKWTLENAKFMAEGLGR